jgi:ubiquinone biosynthesis accessory factor UbiK
MLCAIFPKNAVGFPEWRTFLVRRVAAPHHGGAISKSTAGAPRCDAGTASGRMDLVFARLGPVVLSGIRFSKEIAMLNAKTLEEIAARVGKAIENSPAKDIEKNVKAMLASSLARLDMVPRAEFEVQAQVLLKTRTKLEALEKRLAEIEARFPPHAG